MKSDDELLTVTQAAAYLTCSRRNFYRIHARGGFKLVKVGGSTRVRKSELDRYLRAQERAA